MKKTKAITELENRGAEFSVHEININGFVSGSKLARDGGQDPAEVFKTLVLESTDKKHFVCLIPVDEKLDFKKAAKLFKVKKLSMLPLDKLEALTGYIHGGCSPVAMKTQMPTIIDVSALQHDHIYISAGKTGMEIVIGAAHLAEVISADIADVCKSSVAV